MNKAELEKFFDTIITKYTLEKYLKEYMEAVLDMRPILRHDDGTLEIRHKEEIEGKRRKNFHRPAHGSSRWRMDHHGACDPVW